MSTPVNLKKKSDKDLEALQEQVQREIATRKDNSLREKIKAHMASEEFMREEIDRLKGHNERIRQKQHQRHESRKHLSVWQQPLDASAHRHEYDTIRDNERRIAELEAKLAGARPIEVDLLHWPAEADKNKEMLKIFHELQEKVMRHNMWENIEKAIKYHCFHDMSGWHFLMEFCCLALSILDQKELRLTRGGWDQTELSVPEYISYWYGEKCKNCGAAWAQTCRGTCRNCGHENDWPEHYNAKDAEERVRKAKKQTREQANGKA